MAVSRVLLPTLRAIPVPRPGQVARRFVIGFLFGVLVVVAGLVAFRQAYADRIMPGVVIGGVDVGSLTPAAARAALAERFGALEKGSIVIRSSRGTETIPYARLGRTFDLDGMVGRAVAVGRGGTALDESVAGFRLLAQPMALSPLVDFDRSRLAAELAAISGSYRIQPRDAAVTSGSAGLTVWPAATGSRLDADRLGPAIEAALLDPTTPVELSLTADTVKIAPNVSDADALRARDLAVRMASNVVVTDGAKKPKKWTIPAATVRTWITFARTDEGYLPSIDPTKIPASLGKVSKGVAVKAREATYLRDRSGHILGVSASGAGRALNTEATARAIVGILEARARGASPAWRAKVAVAAVAPKLNTAEAIEVAPLMVNVGSWTTRYQVSPHNGMSANITVPARRLNGTVVRPGQVFDFWNALGEVSFRTGYRLGGAIVGGHSVEGKALAGGICATSTTLFNAAARGGFEILARQPHWYYITRYPVGLDATVSQSQTMRFRNDTKYPILIRAFASPGMVRFEIWSVPNGRKVTWSRPSISNVVRGFDTRRETSSLARGRTERIEWPVDGMNVSVTRTVRDSTGRVVHSDTFVSHYHRMIGILLVGR
jgi:vancomycin resistance protein YoaR